VSAFPELQAGCPGGAAVGREGWKAGLDLDYERTFTFWFSLRGIIIGLWSIGKEDRSCTEVKELKLWIDLLFSENSGARPAIC
jgi:hypothetical protein